MAQPDTATRPRPKESDLRPDSSRPAGPAAGRETDDATRAAARAPRPGEESNVGGRASAERTSADGPSRLDPEERRSLIEYQAYLLYLQRGDGAGSELEDWLAAEREIDGRE